jgi:uncharacterized protein YueI
MVLNMSNIQQFLMVLGHLDEIAMVYLEKIPLMDTKRLDHSASILFLKGTLILNSSYKEYMDVDKELDLEILYIS